MLFAFESVVVELGGRRILDGVEAEIPAAGITCLVGPSGSGKSTLLRLCNRLVAPTSGTVRFRGDDIAGLDPLQLRRQVGMVFQRPTTFPGTVADNLTIAAGSPDTDRFVGLLDAVGLPRTFLDRAVDGLSGGEAQRVCLARTLAAGPEVLLMDEPTSALDEDSVAVLETSTMEIAAAGTPVIWVSHDAAQVDRLADHRVRLVDGRVVPGAGTDDEDRDD